VSKRIDVQVNKDGTFRAEFSGFAGDDCIDHADKLRSVLAGFGLLVDPSMVERKDPAQIALEIGEDEHEQEQSPIRQQVRRPR
jgi:hypothetical protein